MEQFGIPRKFREAKIQANELVEMLLNSRRAHSAAISNLNKRCIELRAEAAAASELAEQKVKIIKMTKDMLKAKSELVRTLELQLKDAQTREGILESRIQEKFDKDTKADQLISDLKKEIRAKDIILKGARLELKSARQDLHEKNLDHQEIKCRFEELYTDTMTSKATIASTENLQADYKRRIEELTLEWKTILKEQSIRAAKEKAHLKHAFEGWKSAIVKSCELKTCSLQEKVNEYEEAKIQLENRMASTNGEMESLREDLFNQITINGGLKTSLERMKTESNMRIKKLQMKQKLEMESRPVQSLLAL